MYASAQNADPSENTIQISTRNAGEAWIDMNRDRLHGIWMQLSGKLREQWGTLANDPFVASAGTRERIAGRFMERRGISKQETDRQLKDFLCRNRNWRDLTRH